MAKLNRVTAKVFAGNAPLDTIGQFGSTLAGTKINTQDVSEIQALEAYEDGWNSAVVSDRNYPTMEETNGVMKVMSYQTAYSFQAGMPEYDPNTMYYTNSFCQVEGVFYKSLTDENIGNDPTTDTSNWEEFKTGGGAGLEIGDISTALYVDETKGLRRYLNGQQVTINNNTQAFLDRLKQIQTIQPALFVTEEQWQSEAAMNTNGYVDKFVIADDESTVRLPNYPDYIVTLSGTNEIPTYGNGITLGMTDGTQTGGAAIAYGTTYNGLIPRAGLIGQPLGTTASGDSLHTDKGWGILTSEQLGDNLENSGLVSNIIPAIKTLTLKYFIQIATGAETENNIINEIELNNPYTLLDYKYTDTPLYNISWLRSTTSFYPKAVYPKVYEALQVEYNTEITAGTTVELPSGSSYTKRGESVKLSTEEYTDYDFVLNESDETFRLKLKTKTEPIATAPVVGNGKALGLQHGTDTHYSLGSNPTNGLYAFEGVKNQGEANTGSQISWNVAVGVSTAEQLGDNLENSGLITNLSLGERSSEVYLYFYVGETVQNANLINAGRIEEKLVDKADTSLVNITDEAKSLIAHQSMPSDEYVDLTFGADLETYLAPADGYVYLTKQGAGQWISLNVLEEGLSTYQSGKTQYGFGRIVASGDSFQYLLPVKKGRYFFVNYGNAGATSKFRFYYAVGSESEAQ